MTQQAQIDVAGTIDATGGDVVVIMPPELLEALTAAEYFWKGGQALRRLRRTGEVQRVVRDDAGEIVRFEPLED